jgi:hypothetical protein
MRMLTRSAVSDHIPEPTLKQLCLASVNTHETDASVGTEVYFALPRAAGCHGGTLEGLTGVNPCPERCVIGRYWCGKSMVLLIPMGTPYVMR